MHTLATFPTLADAHGLRLALEAEGITAVVLGEHSVGYIGGGVAVAVHDPADVPAAQTILHEFTRGQVLKLYEPSSRTDYRIGGDAGPKRPPTILAALFLFAVTMLLGFLELVFRPLPEYRAASIAIFVLAAALLVGVARRSGVARWGVILMCALGLVLGFQSLREAFAAGSTAERFVVVGSVLWQAVACVLLVLPASNAWFRFRANGV